ncbi:kinase-like domain-containing protein [Fomitopsis serialis]|uniref:kinase-like domain-containing protein n=1 Tax=Fomitopsis serialis TaxID=139415 RepID=UPI0020077EDF|nr:kinase-like domain-containing protein [Neoantrodia serialis]KAH9925501.1 kinase-like domain-containing protein [Neoantrodia serialis]
MTIPSCVASSTRVEDVHSPAFFVHYRDASAAVEKMAIYRESARMLLSLASRHPTLLPATREWVNSLHAYLDGLGSWSVIPTLVRWMEIEAGLVTMYRACPFLTVFERDPEWRPDMIETVNAIMEVVSTKTSVKALLDLPRQDAFAIINLLYEVLDNQIRLSIAPRLANRYEWLPRKCIVPAGCLVIVGDTAVDCGGYSDVWHATYHTEGRSSTVALKVFRVYAKDKLQRVRKKFCQEAILWLRLRHKNIVPLLGADMTLFPVCLVSVWMKYGNISGYLRQYPNEDRLRLLIDVAEGLAYLHSESMVHGDLKCANILINDERQACIGDFGLSAVIHDPETIMSITPSPNAVGTLRWTAPEILDPESFGLEHAVASPETDVYSFGMVTWETFSGHTPYEEYRFDAPHKRPPHAAALGLSDLVWDLIQPDTILHELKAARRLSQLSAARQTVEHMEEPSLGGTSLLSRLRNANNGAFPRPPRKPSSLSSQRTLTPLSVVPSKGGLSSATTAQESASAVFTSIPLTAQVGLSYVPSRSRLRAEASEHTLVGVTVGSADTVKAGDRQLTPLLTDVTAPIPFVRSPVSIPAPPIAFQTAPSNCPTPQLTWGGTPLPVHDSHIDARRGFSAPEANAGQHYPRSAHDPGPSKDAIRALEIQRELSGNRNNSWVHDWGYVGGGW